MKAMSRWIEEREEEVEEGRTERMSRTEENTDSDSVEERGYPTKLKCRVMEVRECQVGKCKARQSAGAMG